MDYTNLLTDLITLTSYNSCLLFIILVCLLIFLINYILKVIFH